MNCREYDSFRGSSRITAFIISASSGSMSKLGFFEIHLFQH